MAHGSGIGLGRQQGYQPQQPIFFSHRVHAGLNQISCLLCHGNAWYGKQASVPSLNFCMNCHAAITVYHGERLTRPDDGNPSTRTGRSKSCSNIPATIPQKARIHARANRWNGSASTTFPTSSFSVMPNMFVRGRSNARPVTERSRKWMRSTSSRHSAWAGVSIATGRRVLIFQTAPTTGPETNSIRIYTRFAAELKSGDRDSVTVEDIGGTECQKCHY